MPLSLSLYQDRWLVVVGSFAAFLFGFGTGSNDVANAVSVTYMGTSAILLE